jgi:hypothetical protein
VRRGVQWSPELTAAYVAADAPSAESCNSALIEVCAIADRLVGGTTLMTAGAAGYEVRQLPDDTGTGLQPEVGRLLTAASLSDDFRPMTDSTRASLRALGQTDEMIAFTEHRQNMVLALAHVGRSMGASSAGGVERGAGWVQIAAVAGVAALVGLAVDWYCARASRASQASRVEQAGIVAASAATAERLRVFVETGRMPPETSIETAAAASIRSAAAAARETGFGQQIERAVASSIGGIAKVGGALLLVWGLVKISESRGSQ